LEPANRSHSNHRPYLSDHLSALRDWTQVFGVGYFVAMVNQLMSVIDPFSDEAFHGWKTGSAVAFRELFW
jgi:hypothetical protein